MQMVSKNLYLLLISLFLFAGSCSDKQKNTDNKPERKPKRKQLTEFTSPNNNSRYTIGDSVSLSLDLRKGKTNEPIDSVLLYVNGKAAETLLAVPFTYSLSTADLGTGFQHISAAVYQNGKIAERNALRFELLSDVVPQRYSFRQINRYPHDDKAWTQGLFYADGFLYEGTGQKGASSLRKVELTTGKVLQMQALEAQFFGEGIAAIDNEIFQLTWREQTGFVYDLESFKLLREFRYPTEGWGITTDGEQLIMSDGSEKLYFMDSQGFAEMRQIAVYTNSGPITKLNELEFIDGEIYANVWETDNVVRIDPETGKVLGIVDFSGLMNRSDMDEQAVLNGIAWDEKGKRLFVTGKWWPSLFEVQLTPVQ